MNILCNPDFLGDDIDEVALLVYADWLEETGDTLQANLIRNFRTKSIFRQGLAELRALNLHCEAIEKSEALLWYQFDIKYIVPSIIDSIPSNRDLRIITVDMSYILVTNPYTMWRKQWEFRSDFGGVRLPHTYTETYQDKWGPLFVEQSSTEEL
jgi:uncharacterized protein (TIGR02996 family)